MRVLFLSGSNSRNAGGVFVTALETGKKLISDYKLDINYLMHDDEYSIEDSKQYPAGTLNSYKIIGPKKLGLSLNLKQKLYSLSPSIIHTQSLWMYLSYQAKSYKKKNKIPVIVSPHGMLDPYQLNTSPQKKRIILALYERENLRNASAIHALNDIEYKAIRELGYKTPVAIIPNGVNLPNLKHIPMQPDWKEDGKKTLLFLSRIDPKKNIHTLINAWKKSNYSISNWQLVIAGDLKDNEYCQSLLNDSKGCDSIKFVGGQFGDNKAAAFYYSDAFILPSFSEGLPMAVLEAWSYKKYTLITDGCNLPEAFQVNASRRIEVDQDNLVNSLNTLFNTPQSEIDTVSYNGYNLVVSNYTWDSVVHKMSLLYKWVLGQSPKPDFVHLN